jgi:hypothetical protein
MEVTCCHTYGWLITRVFELDDWIYCAVYFHTVWECRWYRAIAILHTFQFTIAQAPWFSGCTRCILSTDLYQSLTVTRTHFLSYFLTIYSESPSTAIPRTRPNSIPRITAGWHPETRLFSPSFFSVPHPIFWLCSFITLRYGSHRKHHLRFLRMCVYWFVTW